MIIDLATVKQYLSLTDSTYDAQIALYIPDVDALVKEYTSLRYNDYFTCSTVSGSATISVGSIGNTFFTSELSLNAPVISNVYAYSRVSYDLSDYFKQGDYVSGAGIPTGAYITDVDKLNKQITINDVATATGSITAVKGFNRMYNSIVANLVWYKITNASTKAANSASGFVTSISQGPTSKTFDLDRSKLFRGVPVGMLEGLPRYIRMQ